MNAWVWVWVVASAVTTQSLGEVAEREKKRRERNAETGVEAVSFSGNGAAIETTRRSDGERPDGEAPPADDASADEGSPMAAELERAKELEPRMAEIARAADGLDALYQRYLDRCHNRYAVGVTPDGIGVPVGASQPVHVDGGRNWVVVLDAPSSTSTAVPRVGSRSVMLVQTVECQELWSDIVDEATAIKQSMRELLAEARREGILPGAIRELRRKYRLDWSGWER